MRLGVATPGVSPATVRDCLADRGERISVVRASRCGRLGRSLESATTVILCIRRCAVSIHAAERVLDTVDRPRVCRVQVVDAATVPRWLRQRFECPVRASSQPQRVA
ncbi:hypothetical protein EGH24_11325 [Halonotius terrestris]|uniref:Uncharacterized protein n=1 Tax=Halonotius terrestris TaxID=2487750 RepID=A0A8J8P874_9EURY|nr:hypothetical protein [Halonotius terrestris]TQQ79219.1 hypothetical protein EGH24_11325 [Halonotius terrestris]